MTVTREEATALQMALLELTKAGATMRLRDGEPSLSWRPPQATLETLKRNREILVQSMRRLHCFESDTPEPETGGEVEAVFDCLPVRVPAVRLMEHDWCRWRYTKTRLWFHSNGELWLDPVLEASDPEPQEEEVPQWRKKSRR